MLHFHTFIVSITAFVICLQGPISAIQQSSSPTEIQQVQFTPPQGWHFADPTSLPAGVKVMVVGKGSHEFPPSINLGTEAYAGSLKQYLKRIKEINDARGYEWKDLGTIRTQVGTASLSQVDQRTQWGDIRMMHLIFSHEGTIYILTATSLKEEFPNFYREFFATLRSVCICSEKRS